MFRLIHHHNASRRIILLAVAEPPAAAEPSPSPTASPYELFSSLDPSVAIAVLILIFLFFFVGFFSIYIRLREETTEAAVPDDSCDGSRRRGLDPSAMEAFPAFAYSSPVNTTIVKSVSACAVCLSDFKKGEKLRLLPRCGHVFHADCIDGWLVCHVTCPVCRAELAPEVTAESRAGLSNHHVVVNVYL